MQPAWEWRGDVRDFSSLRNSSTLKGWFAQRAFAFTDIVQKFSGNGAFSKASSQLVCWWLIMASSRAAWAARCLPMCQEQEWREGPAEQLFSHLRDNPIVHKHWDLDPLPLRTVLLTVQHKHWLWRGSHCIALSRFYSELYITVAIRHTGPYFQWVHSSFLKEVTIFFFFI